MAECCGPIDGPCALQPPPAYARVTLDQAEAAALAKLVEQLGVIVQCFPPGVDGPYLGDIRVVLRDLTVAQAWAVYPALRRLVHGSGPA